MCFIQTLHFLYNCLSTKTSICEAKQTFRGKSTLPISNFKKILTKRLPLNCIKKVTVADKL